MQPSSPEAYVNLAQAMRRSRRLSEAIAAYQSALALRPDLAEVHVELGDTLRGQGKHSAARESLQRAIQLKPKMPEAHYVLGRVLHAQGRLAEALECLDRALALRSRYFQVHNHRGVVLLGQKRYEAAIAALRQAIAYAPDFAPAWLNLGAVFQEMGRLTQAVEHYRRALSLKRAYPEAHSNLAAALRDLGDLDGAVEHYRRALALMPGLAQVHSNLLFLLAYHPQASPESLYTEHVAWNARHARALKPVLLHHANERNPERRLRVGYVSPDLRGHVCSHYLEPLLANHDPAAVELFAYAEVLRPDRTTERFRQVVPNWRSTVGQSHAMVADQIRRDGIDILVDCAGHTSNNRLLVFAQGPAPIQVTWLGYPHTTGLDTIDYLLSDVYCMKPGVEAWFTEAPYRLPSIFACYRPRLDMPPVSPSPALRQGYVTFGSLTRVARLNEEVVATWAQLLRRVPEARLALNTKSLDDPMMQARLRERFAAHGVASERLLLDYTSPPWSFFEAVDVVLDLFPQCSCTTALESLWMGVPVVTLAGQLPLGRFTASFLNAMGLEEWVTGDLDAYIDRAARAAADRPTLVRLRAELRARMAQSPICDERGFARAMEAAYRAMWRTWCQEAT
ncbi:MAG: tetratricopeptide repeat protein [Gammaproteobacteria bacterium]